MSASGSVGVAVAQFAPGDDEDANLAAIGALAGTAAARGARVVVLPEYSSWFRDPIDAGLHEHAQPLDGKFARALADIAAGHGVVLVAGMAEIVADSARVRNTVIAVDAAGIRAVYRKLHLYDAFGQRESDWIEPGAIETPQTFEVDGLRFGIMTCYDLRFPEVTRRIVDAGADVVLVPSEWVRGPVKEHHWSTLLQARAIENTVFVAAADHTPPVGVGHAMVVDPQGVTRAELGTRADVAVAFLDPAEVAEVRRVNPVLAVRRFGVVPR
ncbi:hydrolase [Microbacterium mangrovi]|uniref:Hydrolase n=1 Tax=Microbacterium mangrovi TaxID=1348253 RepID=A0A0B2A700_9MICO|nr:carbon-nitrogen hydrolase family protein [Microbacterium mangrovi]KHK97553.1 hydrolase [Microbacterium mangrovi]